MDISPYQEDILVEMYEEEIEERLEVLNEHLGRNYRKELFQDMV